MAKSGTNDVVCNLVLAGTLELEHEDDLYHEYRGIVVSGGRILIVDKKACNIRLHDLHNGKLLAISDRLESRPFGISLINDVDICTIMWNKSIEIMSVQCTGDIEVIRRVRTLHVNTDFDYCHAAVKCRDTFIVCGVKESAICWCSVSLNNGHADMTYQVCKGFLSYLATRDNMIYISCYAGSPETGVYGIDIWNPSKHIFIYKHDELNYPNGITVDTKGFIFVCNYKYPIPFLSNPKSVEDQPCIHHLTDRGQLVTIYRKGLPLDLCNIFWDQNQELLYIAGLDSNVITRYKTEYSHQQDLKERDEFLEAIKNNDQKIEEMIRNQKIPQRTIMEVAMKQNVYFKGVQLALIEMSKLLRMEISEAVGVWCGYEPKDPHIPVFVVTLRKNCILKKEDIPEPFIDYKIITRHKYVPNDEERRIVQLYGSESVRSEDVSVVNNCIATHSERLMSEHSNLSIVSPCPIKAYGYMNKKMEVKKNTCIVFYVPVKGIIPVGEQEFPKALDGIVTDVREGEFVFLGGHNAMVYHPKLRMGCCISRCICGTERCKGSKICKIGSLGGFIDLPGDKVGCLTAAHVVLTDEEYQTYTEKSHEEKGIIHYNIAAGDVQIEIHQPHPLVGHKPFGKVLTIALEQGGEKKDDTSSVDAAIIQITDDNRIPETGSFPDGEFRDFGLTKEDPLLYTGGEILDDTEIQQMESPVIKFGCTTGLTQGKLKCSQCSVRRVDVWGKYVFPVMYKQLEVSSEPHVFAAVGDSGALVFLCLGANNRNIRPFGMVLGENSTGCTCVITPIKAVFEKLGLRSDRFKDFPAIQLSQLKEDIIAQGQVQSVQNQVLNSVSKKFESIEQQMIDTIEKVNLIEQKMKEHVDSKLLENFNKINSRVDTLEKNMKENLEHINSDIKASFDSMMEALNR